MGRACGEPGGIELTAMGVELNGPGTYTDDVNMLACKACEKGYACPGNTNRVACGNGAFSDSAGAEACQTCQPFQ